ncbi:MAG: aldo/keto reductase [Candidatus Omnitrophota bacterium]
MKSRRFGRMGWELSEIGFGAWAIGGMWGDQSDSDSLAALQKYIDLGGNFIDTAQAYGEGRSERIIAKVLKERRERIYVATKLPPKNLLWNPPSWTPHEKAFPASYIVAGVETSLKNLQTDCLDIYQLHTWCETWNTADEIFEAGEKLKKDGKIRAYGVSTTESFPECVIGALQTGTIDSLQLIFNLFEQHPRETLFPVCKQYDIGTIVRVPFDEGSLTGKYKGDETFAVDDFRSIYFSGGNLHATVERVEAIREWAQRNLPGMPLAELAMRWVLSHDEADVVIPGIRNLRQAELNTAPSDGKRLSSNQMRELKRFAWRRNPWKEALPPLREIIG